MSTIFISYASQDRERARELAAALEAHDHRVWWDRTIPPGRVFDEVIQETLQAARCVIVLWSSHSVRSNWVKVEAEEVASRGLLVPALIETVSPPNQFKRVQAANLSDWSEAPTSPNAATARCRTKRTPSIRIFVTEPILQDRLWPVPVPSVRPVGCADVPLHSLSLA